MKYIIDLDKLSNGVDYWRNPGYKPQSFGSKRGFFNMMKGIQRSGRCVSAYSKDAEKNMPEIVRWFELNGITNIPIVYKKDGDSVQVWNDKVMQIDPDTGEFIITQHISGNQIKKTTYAPIKVEVTTPKQRDDAMAFEQDMADEMMAFDDKVKRSGWKQLEKDLKKYKASYNKGEKNLESLQRKHQEVVDDKQTPKSAEYYNNEERLKMLDGYIRILKKDRSRKEDASKRTRVVINAESQHVLKTLNTYYDKIQDENAPGSVANKFINYAMEVKKLAQTTSIETTTPIVAKALKEYTNVQNWMHYVELVRSEDTRLRDLLNKNPETPANKAQRQAATDAIIVTDEYIRGTIDPKDKYVPKDYNKWRSIVIIQPKAPTEKDKIRASLLERVAKFKAIPVDADKVASIVGKTIDADVYRELGGETYKDALIKKIAGPNDYQAKHLRNAKTAAEVLNIATALAEINELSKGKSIDARIQEVALNRYLKNGKESAKEVFDKIGKIPDLDKIMDKVGGKSKEDGVEADDFKTIEAKELIKRQRDKLNALNINIAKHTKAVDAADPKALDEARRLIKKKKATYQDFMSQIKRLEEEGNAGKSAHSTLIRDVAALRKRGFSDLELSILRKERSENNRKAVLKASTPKAMGRFITLKSKEEEDRLARGELNIEERIQLVQDKLGITGDMAVEIAKTYGTEQIKSGQPISGEGRFRTASINAIGEDKLKREIGTGILIAKMRKGAGEIKDKQRQSSLNKIIDTAEKDYGFDYTKLETASNAINKEILIASNKQGITEKVASDKKEAKDTITDKTLASDIQNEDMDNALRSWGLYGGKELSAKILKTMTPEAVMRGDLIRKGKNAMISSLARDIIITRLLDNGIDIATPEEKAKVASLTQMANSIEWSVESDKEQVINLIKKYKLTEAEQIITNQEASSKAKKESPVDINA